MNKYVTLSNGTTCNVILAKAPTNDDKAFCRTCTFATIGKDSSIVPDDDWLHRLCEARHSPIRELRFAFAFDNLPYYISTHLARHVHAQPYIQTQRNDRQTRYDRRKAPQVAPVKMIWTMSAEELMTIANKRLCTLADIDTRLIVSTMRDLAIDAAPYLEGLLVPMCEYNGGMCHEMKPCGKYRKGD